MKKLIAFVLIIFCLTVLLSGCEKESEYEATMVPNVIVRISDVSSTGATLTIKDTNQNPFEYGEWYCIEKEDNGKWVEVKTVIDDYGFSDIAYMLDENNESREMKFNIDWEWLYGELPTGRYRILKMVDNRYISAEFDIE